MIDLYYWPTPNGWKISIALEEMALPYAVDRYTAEARRLYGVLDGQFERREYICGDYSIADMACWPWIVPHERQGVNFDDFPNVGRWYEKMKTRPALQRGFDLLEEIRSTGMDAKAKEILFGQDGTRKD